MGSVFYVTVEQAKHSIPCTRHLPNISRQPGAPEPPVETLCRHCPAQTLASCWEILITLFASLVTSAYTLHHEKRSNGPVDSDEPILAFDPGRFTFFLDPSPALMLLFCLVLGCSVSSFAYRHQEQDKFQLPIFVLSIAAASAFGFGLGINANLIMLGLIPWALCFAMIFSTTVHWLVRRCSQHRSYYRYQLDEKEVLLRH